MFLVCVLCAFVSVCFFGWLCLLLFGFVGVVYFVCYCYVCSFIFVRVCLLFCGSLLVLDCVCFYCVRMCRRLCVVCVFLLCGCLLPCFVVDALSIRIT